MRLLFTMFMFCFPAFAEDLSEAAVVPTSTLRYSQNQASCEKVSAFNAVCDTLGLDNEQSKSAKNLVKLLPDMTFITGCDKERSQLKHCLEK